MPDAACGRRYIHIGLCGARIGWVHCRWSLFAAEPKGPSLSSGTVLGDLYHGANFGCGRFPFMGKEKLCRIIIEYFNL
jgi:hypothetical protein